MNSQEAVYIHVYSITTNQYLKGSDDKTITVCTLNTVEWYLQYSGTWVYDTLFYDHLSLMTTFSGLDGLPLKYTFLKRIIA